MRHRKKKFKLGRKPAHRKAMLRNLTAQVIENDRIRTTITRAKAVKPLLEKMITVGKSGSLADKRRAFAFFFQRNTVHKLFNEVAIRFMDRNGGYARIVKDDYRQGDGAQMAYLEFVDFVFEPKKKKKESLKEKAKTVKKKEK